MSLMPTTSKASPPVAAQITHPCAPRIDAGGGAVCRWIVAIYLAGYYVGYTQWVQFGWLVAAVALTARRIRWQEMTQWVKRDAFLQCGLLFLGWMTLRSLLEGADQMRAAIPWLGGLLWLMLFATVAWQAGAHAKAMEKFGALVGAAAALAASVSLFLFYFALPDHLAGERLANWFVYGGLNPVCTGLSFGFAAMWIVCIKKRWPGSGNGVLLTTVQVTLLLAVLFTRSRGALLALATGHATLLLTRGWRQTWKDALVLALTMALFQISGPAINSLSHAQVEARTGKTAAPGGIRNPANEMLKREDSGRMDIYRAGIAALPDGKAWLFGIGQWGTEARWRSHLDWHDVERLEHLHSAYLATLVQGGLVGLGLLALVLTIGAGRAYALARAGESTWLVLLAYGGAALLFDGQTFTRMNSLPLFEPLLVLFPMMMAASGWAHAGKHSEMMPPKRD